MNGRLKKFTNKGNMTMKKIVVIFSVLIGIAVVVFSSAYISLKEIEKQVRQNLKDVARQNAVILESKINEKYKLIISLSKELNGVTEDTIQGKLEHFEIFLKEYNLKRFAYCFPSGITYSTDEGAADLSYREFYKKGMEGKCYITEILADALQKEHSAVNVMTSPVFDNDGNITGVFGVAYDTEVFNESLQIESFDGMGYSCIINENGDIMSAIGSDGLELSYNIIEDVLKVDERNEKVIEDLQGLINQKKEGSGSLYLSEKLYYCMVPVDLMDGSVVWHILTIVPSQVVSQRILPIQKNQYLTCLIVVFLALIGALMIIKYIKEQHRQMVSFAYEDSVTGGANSVKFHVELERKFERSNNVLQGCLIDMDISNFNNISVVAGEAASEKMIKETWNIISSVLIKEELAAHVRDDTFLIFIIEEDSDKILERIRNISEKISEKAKEFGVYGVQARYGMCIMSENDTMKSIYSKAKLAKEYAADISGLNCAFYSEVNRVKIQYKKQLEDSFPSALENEEFKVYYQPKYSATDCKIVGSEALVRWKKSNEEMISPGEFIPLFESNGMIVKLDEYMFRAVCKQQKKWLDEGKKIYPVSINISRASLYCANIHKIYNNIIQEYMIDPKYIQLELTETVMKGKADIYEVLNKFRNMGIKILMDDFGTGYSSFATLSLQCFDTLKLDKTLIDHIGSKDGETMLYHIIRMGQQMGLHITAEGVEKQDQLAFLQNMKCDDIQGFYFSKPVPKDVYEEMLNNV